LEDLIELMPDMMLGDDPTLDAALVDARKIIRNVDSDTIKASETIRNDVRKRAAEIVSSLQFLQTNRGSASDNAQSHCHIYDNQLKQTYVTLRNYYQRYLIRP
jgi:hypothetical protein